MDLDTDDFFSSRFVAAVTINHELREPQEEHDLQKQDQQPPCESYQFQQQYEISDFPRIALSQHGSRHIQQVFNFQRFIYEISLLSSLVPRQLT